MFSQYKAWRARCRFTGPAIVLRKIIGAQRAMADLPGAFNKSPTVSLPLVKPLLSYYKLRS
jgi:hypothetical protein